MSFLDPPKSSTRLVTQNLLVSAAAATEPDRHVTEDNLQDLATVITLVCLYDRLVLIGPKHLLDFDSPLLAYLRAEVVEIREPAINDWRRAVESAERYAGEFLGMGQLRHADFIFSEMYNMSRRYGIDDAILEDGHREVISGQDALERAKKFNDLRVLLSNPLDWITAAYVLRTFLYVGFSDRLGMPLAVDTARQPLLEQVANLSQERLREMLLRVMAEGLQTDRALRKSLRRIASPYAAIVFNEAKERRAIVSRLTALRAEQLQARLDLRPLEENLAKATGPEKDQAEARLASALEVLARRYSVKSTQDLTIRRIVSFAKPAVDLVKLDPTGALEGAAEQLLLKDAEKMLAEFHDLKRKQPSTADQDQDIRRLFDI